MSKFLIYDVFMFLNIVLILANITDPDEMWLYERYHLGFHFLLKYWITGIQYRRVK